jgi:hypothetical protein
MDEDHSTVRATQRGSSLFAPLAPIRTGHLDRAAKSDVRSADVRFGSKADICDATSHVRFAHDSDRKSGHVPMVISALHLKANICSATKDVCLGPEADSQAGCSLPLVRHAMASSRRSSPQNSSPSTTNVGDPKMFNRLASLVFSS